MPACAPANTALPKETAPPVQQAANLPISLRHSLLLPFQGLRSFWPRSRGSTCNLSSTSCPPQASLKQALQLRPHQSPGEGREKLKPEQNDIRKKLSLLFWGLCGSWNQNEHCWNRSKCRRENRHSVITSAGIWPEPTQLLWERQGDMRGLTLYFSSNSERMLLLLKAHTSTIAFTRCRTVLCNYLITGFVFFCPKKNKLYHRLTFKLRPFTVIPSIYYPNPVIFHDLPAQSLHLLLFLIPLYWALPPDLNLSFAQLSFHQHMEKKHVLH